MGGFDFAGAFGGNGSAYDFGTTLSSSAGGGSNTSVYGMGGNSDLTIIAVIGAVSVIAMFFIFGKK
jgi:hypothetical protein